MSYLTRVNITENIILISYEIPFHTIKNINYNRPLY